LVSAGSRPRLHQDCGASNKITNECAIFLKSVRELRGGFKEEAVLDSFFSGTRENTNSPFACLVPFVVLTAKSNPRLSGDSRARKKSGKKSCLTASRRQGCTARFSRWP